MTVVPYPRTETSTFPAIGERRWVQGEFEVVVIRYEYAGMYGEETARVLLDPQGVFDPDNPDEGTNLQATKSLLTDTEALEHNFKLRQWAKWQVDMDREDLMRSERELSKVDDRLDAIASRLES